MIRETNIKVYETDEYSMFKFADWNRKINNSKVNMLVDSISQMGLRPMPIIVNEAYVVIDGQHRLKACEKANVPVQYVIDYGADSKVCRTLNTTMGPWTTQIMIESYAKEYAHDIKNPYVRLNNLLEEYGEAVRTTIVALKSYWVSDKVVRSGNLTISDTEYEQARKSLEFAGKIKQYRKYFNRDAWLHALISLYNYDLFDEERMIKQLKDYGNTLDNVSSIEEAVRGLNELYNFHMRQNVRFVDKWLDLRDER